MSHPNQTAELSYLVGSTVEAVAEGEVGTVLTLRLPDTVSINDSPPGSLAKFEIWQDEEGNERGYLALTEVLPS